MTAGRRIADWREARDYAWLADCSRPAFAWEWLRRCPAYRLAWSKFPGSGASRVVAAPDWPLHRFEDPSLDASLARPIWTREALPSVIRASATRARVSEESFDFESCASLLTSVQTDGIQCLLISDGCRSLRLDITGDDVTRGPVLLDYHLSGLRAVGPSLAALRQFLAVALTGAFTASIHAPERRARRMILLLRARDGLEAGASQRDIAQDLLAVSELRPDWRTAAPSLRSQAQRLIKAARTMAGGGFLQLLDP